MILFSFLLPGLHPTQDLVSLGHVATNREATKRIPSTDLLLI
jgi:hypothetical protein